MTLQEAIKIIKQHNLVRHGKMISKPDPKQLTEALEIAINMLEQLTIKKD